LDILFIHQNFPAQFVHVVNALQRRSGVRLGVVTDQANEHVDRLPTARYRFDARKVKGGDRISRSYAVHAARARMTARAMEAIRARDFRPSVVVGHLGWGETLFVKDVFPDARLITHAEFFYAPKGADVGFDPEFPALVDLEERLQLRAKNAAILAAMSETDIAVAPTRWQASRFPEEWQSKIRVVHEGIDTEAVAPNANAALRLPGSRGVLTANDEVLSFVNRNLEPYRGYHIFMRALPEILAKRPNAHAVIVGGASVSYGPAAPEGQSWKKIFLGEVADRLPMERVHFVDRVPFSSLVALFQITSAHVYLTYPFVLSWSLLQAMSAGAPIVASRTAPVVEAIEDGVNGLLVDFFDVDGLARRVVDTLAARGRLTGMQAAARASVIEAYDLETLCLPRWLKLIERG
jgi:glycosyltransferase involved in cell wall biosynthesis